MESVPASMYIGCAFCAVCIFGVVVSVCFWYRGCGVWLDVSFLGDMLYVLFDALVAVTCPKNSVILT